MDKLLLKAHRLAERIMYIQAKEFAEHGNRRGYGRKPSWHDFYDPLAATCLGDLIYKTMMSAHDQR